MDDVDAFIKYVEANDVLTGKFEFSRNEDLMCLNFTNKKFINFELRGGDYASGCFINCTFDQVLFKDLTLVGVSFGDCGFVECKLSNVESDFTLSNCKISRFTVAKNL